MSTMPTPEELAAIDKAIIQCTRALHRVIFQQLGEIIREINAMNGWDCPQSGDWPHEGDDPGIQRTKVRKIATFLALIHEETSEALTGLRHRDRLNFSEEMADILIRTFDLAYGLGIDLCGEVAKKLLKNARRGLHHGGKVV